MTRRLSLVVVAVLAVAAAACQPAPGLGEQDKAAIRKVAEDAARITNAKPLDNAAYVKLYYADDAEVLTANAPAVRGAAAIEQMLNSYPPISDFKAEIVDIDGRGDLAYVRGKYSITYNPPGAAPVANIGKYVEVWKKQADGGWKVAFDSFSSDLPVPGLSVPTAAAPAADATAEVKAMAPIVGHWDIEGNTVVDAKGTMTAMKATQACEWYVGGWAVACRTTVGMGAVTNEAVSLMYYDPYRKGYVNTGAGSLKDSSGSGRFEIKPGSFIFTSEFLLEGKPAKDRMTLSNMTPEGGTWQYELSVGGGPLKPAGGGTFKKAVQP